MEITKVNVPVKVISKHCLDCPSMEVVCNEVNYGKEVTQYVYECKNLDKCKFLAKVIEGMHKEMTKKNE